MKLQLKDSSRSMVRNAFLYFFSFIGSLAFLVSIYELKSPGSWPTILSLTFVIVAITFLPVVRLDALSVTSFTLSGVIDLFVILNIGPWASIWVNGIEMAVLSVVGAIPVKRIAFNLGQTALCVLAAWWIWSSLQSFSGVFASLLAVSAFFLLNSFLISVYVSVVLKRTFRGTLTDMWKDTALSYLSLLVLGAIGALLYRAYGWSSGVIVLLLFFFIRSMLKQKVEDSATIQRYADELKLRYVSSIQSLARAIDARDPYTFGHSMRVAEMSRRLAKVHAPELDDEDVYFGGLLHDVGKIALPDSILLKPGRLEPDELAQMMQHPLMGLEILRGSGVSEMILQIVRSHHEWASGGGYPDNARDDDFPVVARIVGIVDAFDAMVSNRPYRRGCPIPEAIERLVQSKGTQFDPAALDSFMAMMSAIPEDELAEIGYGEQPPNKNIAPVEELPDATQTLAERFRILLGEVAAKRAPRPEVVTQTAQEREKSNVEAIITVEIIRRLGNTLSDSGLMHLTTQDILDKLGVSSFVGPGARQAAAAQEKRLEGQLDGRQEINLDVPILGFDSGQMEHDVDRGAGMVALIDEGYEGSEPRKRLPD